MIIIVLFAILNIIIGSSFGLRDLKNINNSNNNNKNNNKNDNRFESRFNQVLITIPSSTTTSAMPVLLLCISIPTSITTICKWGGAPPPQGGLRPDPPLFF